MKPHASLFLSLMTQCGLPSSADAVAAAGASPLQALIQSVLDEDEVTFVETPAPALIHSLLLETRRLRESAALSSVALDDVKTFLATMGRCIAAWGAEMAMDHVLVWSRVQVACRRR